MFETRPRTHVDPENTGTDVSVLGAHNSLYSRTASSAPCGQSRLSPVFSRPAESAHFFSRLLKNGPVGPLPHGRGSETCCKHRGKCESCERLRAFLGLFQQPIRHVQCAHDRWRARRAVGEWSAGGRRTAGEWSASGRRAVSRWWDGGQSVVSRWLVGG